MAIQVPNGATGGDDLLEPTRALLQGLSVLPTDADLPRNGPVAAFRGTPDSVSIIEAGGTAMSKGFAGLIAALGGGSVVVTALTGFWEGEQTGVRVALVAGTALFLAAGAIAIAIIVAADVSGRAAGAVAQYEVRRQVAVSFLELSLSAQEEKAAADARAAASDDAVWSLAVVGAPAEVVRVATGVRGTLSGVRRGADGDAEVRITRKSDGVREWCQPGELELRETTF